MMEHSSNNITQTVNYIAEELRRHIVFENETHPDAIALWIVGTYLNGRLDTLSKTLHSLSRKGVREDQFTMLEWKHFLTTHGWRLL